MPQNIIFFKIHFLNSETDMRQTLYLENQKHVQDIEGKDEKLKKVETEMQELKLTIENERNARIMNVSYILLRYTIIICAF